MSLAVVIALFWLQDPAQVIDQIRKQNEPIRTLACDVEVEATGTGWFSSLLPPGLAVGRMEFVNGQRLGMDLFLRAPGELAFVSVVAFPDDLAAKLLRFDRGDLPLFAGRGAQHCENLAFGLEPDLSLFLMDANLLPERALSGGFEVQKEGGRLVLRRRLPPNAFGQRLRYAYTFDPQSARVEAVMIEGGFARLEARVEEFEQIGGVPVPRKVRWSVDRGPGVEVTFRNFTAGVELRAPEWLNDPCLPAFTEESLKAIRRRMDQQKDDARAITHYVVAGFSGSARPPESPVELLERALQLRPESIVVKELLAFRRLGTSEGERFLQQHAGASPVLATLRAVRLLEAGKPAEAREALRQVPAGIVRRQIAFCLDAAEAKQAEDFERLVADAPLGLLQQIEVPRELAARLEERPASAAVRLLLARHCAAAREYERACRHYLELIPTRWYPRLKAELADLVRKAKQRAAPLLERLLNEEADPGLGVILAFIRFAAGDRDGALKAVRQVVASEGPGTLAPEDLPEVKGVAEALLDAGDRELAFEFARSVLSACPLLEELQEEVIHRVCGDNRDKIYDLLKRVRGADWYDFERFEIAPDQVVDYARQRIAARRATLEDFRWIARFVKRDPKAQEGLAEDLRKGTEQFPKDPEVWEGLGDASYAAGAYKEALEAYRRCLQTAAGGLDEIRERMELQFAFAEEQAEETEPFKTRDQVIVKFAHAAARAGQAEEAKKFVPAYVKETGDDFGGARAYEVLGDADRAIELFRRILAGSGTAARALDWWALGRRFGSAQALLRLYGRTQRPGEAYLVCEVVLDALSEEGDPGQRQAFFEARRRELGQKLPEDHFIRPFLERTFDPLPPEKATQVQELAEKLASEDSDERERASRALKAMGPGITPAIREYLSSGEVEVRSRVRAMIAEWALAEAKRKFLAR